MEPLGQDVQRSVSTSRKREHAIITLSSLGEAYPRALARAIGVDVTRLHELMHGFPPRYSIELSLIALGLAEDRRTPQGRAYVITPRGRRKARQLTARKVREQVARRARAEWARGAQVYAHLESAAPTGARTPAPGVSTLSASSPSCYHRLGSSSRLQAGWRRLPPDDRAWRRPALGARVARAVPALRRGTPSRGMRDGPPRPAPGRGIAPRVNR